MTSSDMYEYYKHLLTKNKNPKAETIDVNTITLDKSPYTLQIDKFKTKQHNDKDIQIVKSWLKGNVKVSKPNQLPINLKIFHNKLKDLIVDNNDLLCKQHYTNKQQSI